jgi:hypothetical protein
MSTVRQAIALASATRAVSSDGQSACLTSRRSPVRARDRPSRDCLLTRNSDASHGHRLAAALSSSTASRLRRRPGSALVALPVVEQLSRAVQGGDGGVGWRAGHGRTDRTLPHESLAHLERVDADFLDGPESRLARTVGAGAGATGRPRSSFGRAVRCARRTSDGRPAPRRRCAAAARCRTARRERNPERSAGRQPVAAGPVRSSSRCQGEAKWAPVREPKSAPLGGTRTAKPARLEYRSLPRFGRPVQLLMPRRVGYVCGTYCAPGTACAGGRWR